MKKLNVFYSISLIISALMLLCPLTNIRYQGNDFALNVFGMTSLSGTSFPIEMNTFPLVLIVLSLFAISILPFVSNIDVWEMIKINMYGIYLCLGFVILAYFLYIIKFKALDVEVRDSVIAVILPFINIGILYFSSKRIKKAELTV